MATTNNGGLIDIPIRDIHIPDVVTWWPPAMGWWLLIAGLLFCILCAVFVYMFRNKRKYNRLAKVEFDKVVANFQQVHDPIIYVKNLSVYLRQTAMLFYSREYVASLTGAKWLEFLDQTKNSSSEKSVNGEPGMRFQSETGNLLLTTPYNPETPINPTQVEQLTSLVKMWVAALPFGQLTPAKPIK